jgi:hypothetical protein
MSALPVSATRAVIADPPGEPTGLTLYSDNGPVASITLGPAECVALASDLLTAERRRFGRVTVQQVSVAPQSLGLRI